MKARIAVPGILLSAVAALVLLSPFACPYPDGLEKVADDNAFLHRGMTLINGLLPDYAVPGMKNSIVSTLLAGVAGTVVVFAVTCGLVLLIRKTGTGKKR